MQGMPTAQSCLFEAKKVFLGLDSDGLTSWLQFTKRPTPPVPCRRLQVSLPLTGWPGHFVVNHCIGNIDDFNVSSNWSMLMHLESWCMDIQMDVDPAVRLPEAPVDAFQAQKRCWASLSQMKRETECKKAVPIAFPFPSLSCGTSSGVKLKTYQLGITWNHAVLLHLLGC